MATRKELIEKYPPPYRVTMFDKKKRKIGEPTKHPTLSSLELEVEVAQAKVRDEKDPAADYQIDGIPKSEVKGKFEARKEMTKEGAQ